MIAQSVGTVWRKFEYDVTSRWLTDRSIVWPSVSQKPDEGFFRTRSCKNISVKALLI